jgi:MFS superfamily sulfate permease-like transporter
MVRIDELKQTAKQSRLDGLVLVVTLVATVVFDLISALLIGLALYLVLRRTKLSKRLVPIDAEETLGD